VVVSTNGTVPGCSQSYKNPGWLARHIKSNHGLAVPKDPITPPSAVITDVRLPIGEKVRAAILAGRTPNVVSPRVHVSSSGEDKGDAFRCWFLTCLKGPALGQSLWRDRGAYP
jgi:hypothetical protein